MLNLYFRKGNLKGKKEDKVIVLKSHSDLQHDYQDNIKTSSFNELVKDKLVTQSQPKGEGRTQGDNAHRPSLPKQIQSVSPFKEPKKK